MSSTQKGGLGAYRKKREFARTAEPSGGSQIQNGGQAVFVVHKHAARHLHWDFRLQHNGVLWSWAVPKGPSMDPSDKRLAVRVEDHPLDYAGFEGRIPQGEYGAGTVEIWDEGHWKPHDDACAGLSRGELKFTLYGRRLSGEFALVGVKPRGRQRTGSWLLIKVHDGAERVGADAETLEQGHSRVRETPIHQPGRRKKTTPKELSMKGSQQRARSQGNAAGSRESTKVGQVKLTHPDRELWPGITKRNLANYWSEIANAALPELAARPLAVVRCPDGVDGQRFFQKHSHRGVPVQIRGGEAGGQPYLAIDDADGLAALTQIAAIELHSWRAHESDPSHPDRLVFDLDPGEGVPFGEVTKAAHVVRARLGEIGLQSFCRTTGGRGLHVIAPIIREYDWSAVRTFCHDFANLLAESAPERFVSAVPKRQRKGRILVDWLRNGLGATAIASFSPRAHLAATVATPLAWQEVTHRLDPEAYTLASIPRRLKRQGRDPWGDFATLRQPLPALGNR